MQVTNLHRMSEMSPTQWFFFQQIAAVLEAVTPEASNFHMDDMTLLVAEDFVLARWPGWQSDIYLDLFQRWHVAPISTETMRRRVAS